MFYGFVRSLAALIALRLADKQPVAVGHSRLFCAATISQSDKRGSKLLSSYLLRIGLTTQVERRKPKSPALTPFRSITTVPQPANHAPLHRAPAPHCFGLWYLTCKNLCPKRCPHALRQAAYQRFRHRLHKRLQHAPYRLLQFRLRGAGLLKQMHRLPRQSANHHGNKLRRHERLRQHIDRAIPSRPRCPYTLLQRS